MSSNDLKISIIFPNDSLKLQQADKGSSSAIACASNLAYCYVRLTIPNLTSRDLAHFQCCALLQNYEDQIEYDSLNGLAMISISKARLTPFKYFQALLNSGMLEAQQSKIEMKTLSLIDFLHSYNHIAEDLDTLSCELCNMCNYKLLYKMLETLLYLQNDELIEKSINYLITNMTRNSCVQGLIFGETYSISELKLTSMRFCLHYADFVTKNFMPMLSKNLSDSSMDDFINHPQLALWDEESVKSLRKYGIVPSKNAMQASIY